MFTTIIRNSKNETITEIDKILFYEDLNETKQIEKYEKAVIEKLGAKKIKIDATKFVNILEKILEDYAKLQKTKLSDLRTEQEKSYIKILSYLRNNVKEKYIILEDTI